MGSPTGSPIPIYDNKGNQIDFKKDENGNLILTKLDELTLQNIASKSNGKYYFASGSRNELDDIYKDLSKLQETEFGTRTITDYDDKYYYFLIPALFVLILEFFITDNRSNFFDRILKRT
ncbi:MAG: hypothetical protein LC122_02280 [Chitinophagales bacterium]|nr:hypothetical protein [Chitinophagales bacterium]